MKLLGAGVLFAALACAQTYELRGTVMEPGVGGIAGIALQVWRYPEGDSRLLGTDAVVAALLPIQTTTDARGGFRISLDRPGDYSVLPDSKNGVYYIESIEGAVEGRVTLDTVNPQAEVRFSLVRNGQITGLVRDEETRQPVADYPVVLYIRDRLMQRYSIAGFIEEPVRTDRDGRFTMAPLRPGEYVVGTRVPPENRYESADPPDPNPDALDSGYAVAFWPGGSNDTKAAPPIQLASGGIVDIGTVLLRKTPLYKIHVSIPQGACPEGESVLVMLFESGAHDTVRPPSVLPCGGRGDLRGFDPGSYTLYAASFWQGDRKRIDQPVWAVAPVTITDKNEDIPLALEHGALLEGHITVPEGTTAPERHPTIVARSTELIPLRAPPTEHFDEWTSDTTFRMMVRASPQLLYVSGAPAEWYEKEIRYNGVPVRNYIVPVSPDAAAQKIEIVMDNKVARLSGTVLFETKAAAPVLVLLGSATPDSVERFPRVLGLPVEENGQFSQQNVVPGDYLIKAVVVRDRSLNYTPDVMERLLAGGEKITLGPGESRTVTLRLTETGR